MSKSSKVSILGIGQIMFSQNVLFHAQFTKFSTSLKSDVPSLRHADLFLNEINVMKFEICNFMMSISTERGSFYMYMYLMINY